MKTDKEILIEAKKRYDDCETQWGEMKQKNTELLQFISGEQWTYQARQNFENAGYTAMTSNRIPTFLRQITNEIRKNTPEIQIDPRDDGAEKKAEMLNDLVRNIQEESKAEIAYCEAAESAASIGIGYIRVLTKYKNHKSMDQEIIIDPIMDANMVMLDPNHLGIAGEDCEYAFITTVLTKDEYRRRYGKSKLAKRLAGEDVETLDMKDASWTPAGKRWTTDSQILINEYYFKDFDKKTLYQIFDSESGQTFTTYELDKAQMEDGSHEILQEREVLIPIIRWCKLNDLEVLEKSEWPGCYIPVVAVKGDEFWIEGKRKLLGAVEPAVEAQVQLNYAMSWRAQLLQMAPKAPYIGTAAQFKTYEQEWANINVSNQAFMTYNKDEGAQPPTRDLGEVPIQSASVLVTSSGDDLKAIFGTFDPSQQAAGPESGKALLARQDQSYNSNYHFYDNLARSIQHVGCIIVEAIPVVYDSARQVQVLSQDGKKRSVSINQPNEEGVVEYDMTVGDYTVSIQTGPSFGTKRQEESEAIMELIGVYPESAPAIADIAVRSMDWPGADKIADSLEAMVPPQVLAARKTDPKQAAAMMPQLQAQVQQLTQQNQVLTQQVQQAANKMQESADKIQIEHMKAAVDEKKIDSESHLKMKELELDEQRTELEFLIKEQELKLARAELELKRAQLGISATKTLSDMNDNAHDHTMAHIDRVIVAQPGSGETALDGAEDAAKTGMQGSLGGDLKE